jgi:uncharacterized ion transporter superfamily protein YfcC
VTLEEQQDTGFEVRMALAKLEDRREMSRRTEVVLQVTAVTLAWMVLLALLLGWGMTGSAGGERQFAALVAVVLPFVAGVIATKNGYVWLGGAYVALTLAMVVPAIGIAGLV